MLVLEDFKHMAGLAAGVSKLIMTLISTLGSFLVTRLYDDSRFIDQSSSGRGLQYYFGSGSEGADRQECSSSDNRPLGLPPARFLLWVRPALVVMMPCENQGIGRIASEP